MNLLANSENFGKKKADVITINPKLFNKIESIINIKNLDPLINGQKNKVYSKKEK